MSAARYRIGFLMDAYDSLNLATETSLLCMDELIARGHSVYWLEQSGLSLWGGRLYARLVRQQSTNPFLQDPADTIGVEALDALVIRKDPPFDKSYLHLTYLLDFLDPAVVQINSPGALRDVNEKVHTLKWPEYCPDTMVSRDPDVLLEFASRYDRVVLKPLDDCSGRGIRFAGADAASAARIRAMLEEEGYVLAQEFLPGVRQGDKRVYLVNGQPVGWVNRIPAPGSDLANIHQGAICRASELTMRERNISEVVGADLVNRGILLAGLDFIDGRLTEINVTSPSAVRQINEVAGSHLEIVIVDAIVDRIESMQPQSRLASSPGDAA